MRIFAVLPLYPPRSRVGAWLTTHEYLAAAVDRGHHVDVLVTLNTDLPYVLDGVHVHPRSFGAPKRLPDIVVSHLGDRQEGARYAQRVDRPSVRFVHGYAPDNAYRLDQCPTALAIFSSVWLVEQTRWDGPMMVAHPPVYAERYKTAPGCHVTQCNLSKEKGGMVLRKVATALHSTPFLAVRGGYGQQITRQPRNVEVLPATDDMRSVYERTRILLTPTEIESYGRVPVEAACSGIPTIAHPAGGLVEAMGKDGATWVDRNDIHGWVQAVRDLHDPDAWDAASARAQAVADQLQPDETVRAVVDALETCAR